MGELKLGRVQSLSLKLQFLQYLAVRLSGTTVDRVAEQRMTDRGHVHPDLVGPASLQPAFDQRHDLEEVEPLPVTDRALAALAFEERDLLSVGRRRGERSVDSAAIRFGPAVHEREMAPADRVRGE